MARIEKILGLVILILLSLQLFDIPGMRFLLVFLLMVTVPIYLLLSVFIINRIKLINVFAAASYKNLTSQKIIGSIIFGFVISNVLLGILYNLQNWQGAREISIVSYIFLSISLIVVGYKYIMVKSDFYLQLIIRMGVIGAMGILAYFV